MAISKVLVANRSEIAVRIIRAAQDAGIKTVAIYADADQQSLFAQLADEAYALHGATPADTYLNTSKILNIAARSGADAIHPGYGFLAENADFAAAVIAAGLTWIGPPPEAITALGDKVKARHIAQKVGAPLVPGTPDPVSNADEVIQFAQHHGVPIAIKAAFGGGGRGLKVARSIEEIPELFESATREAITAFGRGECFVERYLDKPRHVETQCLADKYGNVVIVSTRDCSLQRRHQKLVEEAPAAFLSLEQIEQLYESSRAIMREAGYVGAGTCEFLVGNDGTISFLEVNTRLQVEHPVSEEVTGLDLVREQFRIAQGQPLGFDDPEIRGHSIEFRINAEDAGRNFMPAPGTLVKWLPPTGPGIRVDEGYHAGMTVPGAFDSLVAKIIVTGQDRQSAISRARRALRELQIDGMPTVVPFHIAILDDPAFVKDFSVHTRWIETEFSGQISPFHGVLGEPNEEGEPELITVEVNGKRIEVKLPGKLGMPQPAKKRRKPTKRDRGGAKVSAPAGNAFPAPMQGTIVKVNVADGQEVEEGDVVAVIEAMKMEQPLSAHRSGIVRNIRVEQGQSVAAGDVLLEIVDPG